MMMRTGHVARAERKHGLAADAALPQVFTLGAKGSGKSTLVRFLVNSMLSAMEEGAPSISGVAYLDLDAGQPEHTVPGLLSLALVRQPLLTPPHLRCMAPVPLCLGGEGDDPLRSSKSGTVVLASRFVGDASPAGDSEVYVAAALDLLSLYRAQLAPSGIPLVVNGHGWLKGLGFETLQRVLDHACPTDVIYLDNRFPRNEGQHPPGERPTASAAGEAGWALLHCPVLVDSPPSVPAAPRLRQASLARERFVCPAAPYQPPSACPAPAAPTASPAAASAGEDVGASLLCPSVQVHGVRAWHVDHHALASADATGMQQHRGDDGSVGSSDEEDEERSDGPAPLPSPLMDASEGSEEEDVTGGAGAASAQSAAGWLEESQRHASMSATPGAPRRRSFGVPGAGTAGLASASAVKPPPRAARSPADLRAQRLLVYFVWCIVASIRSRLDEGNDDALLKECIAATSTSLAFVAPAAPLAPLARCRRAHLTSQLGRAEATLRAVASDARIARAPSVGPASPAYAFETAPTVAMPLQALLLCASASDQVRCGQPAGAESTVLSSGAEAAAANLARGLEGQLVGLCSRSAWLCCRRQAELSRGSNGWTSSPHAVSATAGFAEVMDEAAGGAVAAAEAELPGPVTVVAAGRLPCLGLGYVRHFDAAARQLHIVCGSTPAGLLMAGCGPSRPAAAPLGRSCGVCHPVDVLVCWRGGHDLPAALLARGRPGGDDFCFPAAAMASVRTTGGASAGVNRKHLARPGQVA